MSEDTRPLTEPERRYLEWWLKSGILPAGPGAMDKVVLSCMTAGCLTALAFGVVAIVLKVLLSIAATSLAARNFRSSEWFGRGTFALPLLFWAGMLFYFFVMRRRKPAPELEDPKKLIQEDLSEGIARIHRFRATDVIVAHADGRRERNYFVRLDDGRVLYLGPWCPPGGKIPGMTFLPDEKGFPSTTFEIAATPNDLLILDVVGTGEYLRPVDEFELNEEDEPSGDPSRLEAGSFVKVAWEDLRKTYG
jgi:hypothetical protein